VRQFFEDPLRCAGHFPRFSGNITSYLPKPISPRDIPGTERWPCVTPCLVCENNCSMTGIERSTSAGSGHTPSNFGTQLTEWGCPIVRKDRNAPRMERQMAFLPSIAGTIGSLSANRRATGPCSILNGSGNVVRFDENTNCGY
jgi:hypothetical protein